MLFNSMNYLMFFPIVLMIYFLLPVKIRYVWLLFCSYYFYSCWYPKHTVILLFCTIVTYIGGLLMGMIYKNTLLKKLCMAGCIIINIAILAYFKYRGFAFDNLSELSILTKLNISIPKVDYTLPVGISFYTFQAMGYLIDVYRGNIKAEKNFLKYALFVSFFPQLVAGPIERSGNLLKQIHMPTKFNADRARNGLLTIAYGLFIKVVIADNIAAVIDPIFGEYETWNGTVLLMATVLFAFQIYCDFEGYTKIAIGSAEILGFTLMDNFAAPYMAGSVKEFWDRWHISLTSWFRDYLYIPLGGNRKGKLRKYINTLIVFGVSGLWHGAGWHYAMWGEMNGIMIVAQDATRKWRDKIYSVCRIDRGKIGWKIFSVIVTFGLIDFAWLFFRADSMGMGVDILHKICTEFKVRHLLTESFWEGVFPNIVTMMILMASLFVLLFKDWLKARGVSLKQCIFNQQLVFRWLIYMAIIMVVIFGGAYGEGYEQTQFIYFQF